ncbi:Peptidase_M3 domain-containing protein [Meloidogyne graminicola]|uniref:Peptidase_M3 domain-containing protein n=1 Tax=Meloidogyne graminicola TaxID=189291 RepID=A0A8S9Z6L2_9BILA|nr:Peptidase_M3 domain-containing protein [Meloidogyne graminicola]
MMKQQEILLKRLISARHEIAQLTNFPTFAHRAQINSILYDYNNDVLKSLNVRFYRKMIN